MKKSAIVLFLAALLTGTSLFAQDIQEGINNLYAERRQSAKAVFDKLIAKNPNNMEATYWLGQTYLATNDTADAHALYQKALAANGNAPLVLVGMGHVELLEGKPSEARQRFEAAITMSKGKKGNDPNVLNAIGRANVDAKAGDVDYAIAKLTEAAQLDPKNADIFLNLGNAYRKKHEGGNAVTNYMKAIAINQNYAPAWYQIARIYETQRNWEVYTQNLERAIQADPKFAPAYYGLYYYTLLYPKDFAKAEQYANQYIANSDPSPDNDYIKAQNAWVQNKFDEAITTAKNIITQAGDKANPRVYRLLGYSYLSKGDTTTACQYVGQLFQKMKDEDVVAQDYILQADACGKENPAIVRESYMKAAQIDSNLVNQINILNQGIERFQKSGNKAAEADLRLLSYQLRGSQANPTELVYIGIPYYQAKQYQKADSVFKAYSAAEPDSIYGYLWSARSLSAIDSTMEQGTAVDAYKKLLEVSGKDSARFQSYGVESAGYLAGYYNNIKSDKATAIEYLKQGLKFDPNNQSLQNALNVLQKSSGKPAAPAKSGGPNSGTSGAKK